MFAPLWDMTYHSPSPPPASIPVNYHAHFAVTLRLAHTRDDLLVRHVRLLRDCVGLAQQRWEFTIEAAAVLPSEVQLLCRFQDANYGVQQSLRMITTTFERHLPTSEGDIWGNQHEVIKISPAVAALRKTFIEAAPVRAGLVNNPRDWPYSSAHVDTLQSMNMGVSVA